MLIFYDREGRPIDLAAWVSLSHDDYRKVARDELDGWLISTIWTGLDLSGQPPLIFETMIFKPDGSPCYQERWPTEAAALAGHDQAVAAVRDHDVPTW